MNIQYLCTNFNVPVYVGGDTFSKPHLIITNYISCLPFLLMFYRLFENSTDFEWHLNCYRSHLIMSFLKTLYTQNYAVPHARIQNKRFKWDGFISLLILIIAANTLWNSFLNKYGWRALYVLFLKKNFLGEAGRSQKPNLLYW